MIRQKPLARADGKARLTVALKPKRCKACRESFTPTMAMQTVCDFACAKALVDANKVKEEAKKAREAAKAAAEDKRQTRAQLEALKTRSDWIKEAQAAFNAWIRLRDAGQPCISCGRHHGGKWNAGHYRSTGAAPELRFEPLNVHLQCEPCNTHLSGNLIPYRANLLQKIGPAMLAWIEGPHDQQKWTVEQLKTLRNEYRVRVRAMKANG